MMEYPECSIKSERCTKKGKFEYVTDEGRMPACALCLGPVLAERKERGRCAICLSMIGEHRRIYCQRCERSSERISAACEHYQSKRWGKPKKRKWFVPDGLAAMFLDNRIGSENGNYQSNRNLRRHLFDVGIIDEEGNLIP